MRQFIEVDSKETKCDICQKRTHKKERCFIMIETDSIVVVCYKCGEYIWKMIDSTIMLFSDAVNRGQKFSVLNEK